MKQYKIEQLPNPIIVKGRFDISCEVSISPQSLSAIEEGKLKIAIIQHGGKPTILNFSLSIGSISGNVRVHVGNDNATIVLGEGSRGQYDFRLWRNSRISIGEKTTSNGIRIVCDNSEFVCGEDCMFSDSILIQTADQHGIVDIKNGVITNNNFKTVIVGDHVWLGRQSILTANASIGSGSVIGTASTVTKKIPEKVIAVGVPAKVIKENYTWCRSPMSLDSFSKKYINEDC